MVQICRVNEDICVAKGIAKENRQFGSGGAIHSYVSGYLVRNCCYQDSLCLFVYFCPISFIMLPSIVEMLYVIPQPREVLPPSFSFPRARASRRMKLKYFHFPIPLRRQIFGNFYFLFVSSNIFVELQISIVI